VYRPLLAGVLFVGTACSIVGSIDDDYSLRDPSGGGGVGGGGAGGGAGGAGGGAGAGGDDCVVAGALFSDESPVTVHGVAHLPDGAVVTGEFSGTLDGNDSAGLQDIFVARVDTSGELVWLETFGGPGIDIGYDITLFKDQYVVVGQCAGAPFDGFVIGSAADTDGCVIALNPNGGVSWQVGSYATGNDEARAITVDGEQLWVAGAEDNTLVLYRIENFVSFFQKSTFSGVGAASSIGLGLAAMDGGGVVLTGQFTEELVFDFDTSVTTTNLETHAFVARIRPNLDVDWALDVASELSVGHDVALSEGLIVVAGQASGSVTLDTQSMSLAQPHAFVLALDEQAAHQWSYVVGSDTSSTTALGVSISDGVVAVVGHSQGDDVMFPDGTELSTSSGTAGHLLTFELGGTPLGTRTFETDTFFQDVALPPGGEPCLAIIAGQVDGPVPWGQASPLKGTDDGFVAFVEGPNPPSSFEE